MKTFFNKIIDIISFIFSKLSYLIIILVLGLIIFSRLNNLFDVEILSDNGLIAKNLNIISKDITSKEEKKQDTVAKIIYKGGKPSEEDILAQEEFAKSRQNLVSFTIEANEVPQTVAEKLQSLQLIVDPASFLMMLDNLNLLDKIEPGKYEVVSDIKNKDLISIITNTDMDYNGTKNKPVETEGSINLISFEIKEGNSLEDVAATLKNVGLIQDTTTFIMLVKNANLANDIKPGVYRLPKDIKNLDLIESITIAVD